MGRVDRVGTCLLDIIWKKRPLVNEVWLRGNLCFRRTCVKSSGNRDRLNSCGRLTPE
jgi:hypothetical protein